MNDKYTYLVCYKCDGRGYLRDWENKSYQCDICNGKGEVKVSNIIKNPTLKKSNVGSNTPDILYQ